MTSKWKLKKTKTFHKTHLTTRKQLTIIHTNKNFTYFFDIQSDYPKTL
jgi:hypothetical protein